MSGIELVNISYSIKEREGRREILKNISGRIEENSIVTIQGPSGSGKTTLLYAIAGLLDGLKGKVIIDGKNIYELNKKQRDAFRLQNMSIVFQNLNLFKFLSVEDNILMPLYIKKEKNVKAFRDKMSDYLSAMSMNKLRKEEVRALSGGEQQRVAILRSFVNNSKYILCDEPTANLDKKNTLIFMQTLQQLKMQTKATVIIVTHDEKVFQFGEQKIYLDDGLLLQ